MPRLLTLGAFAVVLIPLSMVPQSRQAGGQLEPQGFTTHYCTNIA